MVLRPNTNSNNYNRSREHDNSCIRSSSSSISINSRKSNDTKMTTSTGGTSSVIDIDGCGASTTSSMSALTTGGGNGRAHTPTTIKSIISGRNSNKHHSKLQRISFLTSSDDNDNEDGNTRDGTKSQGSGGNNSGSGSGSGTNPNDNLNGKHNEKDRENSRTVMIGRGIFVTCLLLVAGILGYLAYYFLNAAEISLVEKQYHAKTTSAFINVRLLAENKLVHGTQIMAKHVGWSFPNKESWPFIWVPSYWDIMSEVLPTSIWSGVNLAPIVLPTQAAEFEEFAYTKFYENFGDDTNMGAKSSFGKGIWVQDPIWVPDVSDHRYHDTTGEPLWDSPYTYLAPKIQDGLVYTPYTMMNVHGFEIQGKSLDAVMNCSFFERKRMGNETVETVAQGCNDSDGEACKANPKRKKCSALSGMLPAKNIKDEHGIAGFIATPIYPANDPFELVGYIFGIVYWIEVMADMFPADTVGIDCIFSDQDYEYTYTIHNKTSELICEGDCHNTNYDKFKMVTEMVDPTLLSNGSMNYFVTCYPNDEFYEKYTTSNPIIAAIGTVAIILMTSVIFFLYDSFVRKEFNAKQNLFEAKRKFVRFVSHEVRTPMNSVCMGLNVLQEEAMMALGGSSTLKSSPSPSSSSPAAASSSPEASEQNKMLEHWIDLVNEISFNAQASVDVLDDFLNYDKIATGELHLEYTIVPIWNLIDETVSEFKLPMSKKNLTLHFNLPDATDIVKTINELLINNNDNTPSSSSSSSEEVLEGSDDTFTVSNSNRNTNTDEKRQEIDLEKPAPTKNGYSYAHDQKLIGDSVRITQVIRNLVSNAIKFSKEKGDIYISTKFEALNRSSSSSPSSSSNKKMNKKRMTSHQKNSNKSSSSSPPSDSGGGTKSTFKLKSQEVITCEKTGNLSFTIKDTGAGLSKPQLKKLFGSGVQFDVNELQAGKGSGLGLYIAKGIVEQHGGQLTADSDGLGLGTTFTMTLPIYNVPQDVWNSQLGGSSSPYSGHDSNSTAHTGKLSPLQCSLTECNLEQLEENENEDNYDGDQLTELKILLVDDSNSNRKLLDRLLSLRGHKCDQADDGHLGVEMVIKAEQEHDTKPYDIIFMDYEMPTMCGPDAVKEIREYGCDVYIIGLTGNIMADDVGYFRNCGANAVFPKPFKVKEFESLVNETLERDSLSGRIVEKKSGRLDLITLGLMQDCESSLGHGDNDTSSTFDASIRSLDNSNSKISSLLTMTPSSSSLQPQGNDDDVINNDRIVTPFSAV